MTLSVGVNSHCVTKKKALKFIFKSLEKFHMVAIAILKMEQQQKRMPMNALIMHIAIIYMVSFYVSWIGMIKGVDDSSTITALSRLQR